MRSLRTFFALRPFTFVRRSYFGQNKESLSDILHKPIKTDEEASYNRIPTEYMQDKLGIVKRRRLQRKYFEMEDEKKKDYQIFIESYSDVIIEMELFMDHLSYDCQKIDAVMNFYQIAYKRNQNLVFLEGFKINYGDQFKDRKIEWPILRVFVSLEPVKFLMGANEIEQYLTRNNFINAPRHFTNSAWAKQGEEFIFLLNLTYQNIFKSAPETYQLSVKTYILIRAFRLNFTKIMKTIFKNLPKLIREKEKYRKIKNDLIEAFNQWEVRLQGQNYHGGESPDEADFALYALLKTKYNSSSFQKFLENKISTKAYNWFVRMQMNCKYEKERFLVQ